MCVCTKSLQSCLTSPGNPLQWVDMPFSRGSFQPRDRTRISYISYTGKLGLLQSRIYICCCDLLSHYIGSDSLRPSGLQPTKLLSLWVSLGKITGVDFCAFLKGIFPTQGLNPRLWHCRWILCHWGSQDICIHIANSLHCMAETNATL